jgi:hypothetical protein
VCRQKGEVRPMATSSTAERVVGPPPRGIVRVAGFMFLFSFIVPTLNWVLGLSRLVVADDVAATARNIVANEAVFRIGIAVELVMSAGLVVLAVALYALLKSVDRNLALLALGWKLVEATLSAVGVLMSLAAVVLLMAGLFESFSQTLAILITLPLALFGAFWALWIFGFTLDVLAVIGVIILIGLVVNNGIVMVVHVNDLRREGQPRIEALVTGCGDRLRPVLMTAITTVAGLVPLAMSPLIRRVALSTFGIEISQFTVAGVYIESMAVALMGGLISSTIFTLIALPVWYSTIEDLGALLAGLWPRGLSGGRLRVPRGGILVDSARRLE